jgi:hypothetical protein
VSETFDTSNPSAPDADAEELMGEFGEAPALIVEHDGPVTTHELPTMIGGIQRWSLALGAAPVKVRNADPRRARVWLQVIDHTLVLGDDAQVAGSQAEAAAASTSWRLIANAPPIPWNVSDELWARAVDGATNAPTLQILVEQWSR